MTVLRWRRTRIATNVARESPSGRRTAPIPQGARRARLIRLNILHMGWHDLAFFHWPIETEPLVQRLPDGVQLDTFQGQAWLGITPFLMTGVRPACVPPVPGVSKFCELNVRTYVVADGIPGIWFFSLDAAQPLAVGGRRR